MRKIIFTSIASCFLSLQALCATNIQETFEATMNVVDARNNFVGVKNAVSQLIKEGEIATSMVLEFENSGEEVFYYLDINYAHPVEFGCMNYSAYLNGNNNSINGFRFTVNLIDYSSCTQSNSESVNTWQAFVRSGYGWCGTMDSTMELRGNPELI
jgi:hypothetical protein